MNVLDLTQLINYPVSADYTARVLFCSQGFRRPGQKAQESPRRGSYL
jgi:hypothetical protein